MRKNIISFLLMIILMAAGCGEKDIELNEIDSAQEVIDNIVIIAGNHANSKKANYDCLDNVLEEVALKYGNICIIVDDGDPFIAADIEIPQQKAGLSSSKKKSIAQSQVIQIKDLLISDTCMAKTEGVNMVKSFEIVERILQSSRYLSGTTVVFVFDTGLSTKGIDFTQMNENMDFPIIVNEYVEMNHMNVSLSNTDIFWYGLCDVAKPQDDLSKKQRDIVEMVWTEYLCNAGAEVQFMSDICTDEYACELPKVKIIETMTNSLFIDEYVYEDPTESIPEALIIDETSIEFIAGAAEIKDYESAEDTLNDIVCYLKKHKEINVLLIGCTAAWGDLENYCIPLSKDRCDTVKSILVNAGISENRIQAIGMGYDNPFYTDDHDESGKLLEDIASANRCIVLMDANSQLAKQIIDGSWKG